MGMVDKSTARRRKAVEFGLLALAVVVSGGIVWGVIQLPLRSGPAHAARESPVVAVESAVPVASAPVAPAVEFEGVIAAMHPAVQMRARAELAWTPAAVGREVRAQDAIQTLANASALITVRGQGDIRIGENSLVAFDVNTADALLPNRRVVASVDHGELAGSLKAGPDTDALGIRLPHGAARLQGARPGGAAEFRLLVHQDKSTELAILRGRSQVSAAGVTRTLHGGEGIRMSADGRLVAMQTIPPAPGVVAPATNQVFVYQKGRPQVSFRWQSPAPVDDYRFQLARDRGFNQTLVDVRMSDTRYTSEPLPTGEYFWRVSGRRGWLDGPATAVASVRVERDIDASVREALEVLYAESREAKELARRANGILVFPRVIKGGIIVGGEFGEGALLSRDRIVDYYTLNSASLGLQLGAQTRKVFLLFMTPEALQGFKSTSGWRVGVDGSVTVVTLSTATTLDSAAAGKSIIGFVLAGRGLMGNLTIEGSRITRLPD